MIAFKKTANIRYTKCEVSHKIGQSYWNGNHIRIPPKRRSSCGGRHRSSNKSSCSQGFFIDFFHLTTTATCPGSEWRWNPVWFATSHRLPTALLLSRVSTTRMYMHIMAIRVKRQQNTEVKPVSSVASADHSASHSHPGRPWLCECYRKLLIESGCSVRHKVVCAVLVPVPRLFACAALQNGYFKHFNWFSYYPFVLWAAWTIRTFGIAHGGISQDTLINDWWHYTIFTSWLKY